jgi:hypothetical protein
VLENYEELRIELCERCRHDVEALDLIRAMDVLVQELIEDYVNLQDPEERDA